MRLVNMLASIVIAVSVWSCGGKVVVDDTEDDGDLGPSKSRWSFELPSEGTPNDNGHIGPFCCTGVTSVVVSDDGRELGYAYFFNVHGQPFTNGKNSFAPDFAVLIAGVTDLEAEGMAELELGEVAFEAGELVSGLSRSAQAGALFFTVTIRHADLQQWSSGLTTFELGSLTVRVDVDPVE